MKKFILYSAMFFGFITASYKLFFYFDHKSEQEGIAINKSISRLTSHELSLIHEGDIILRRGFGFFSDYIANNLNPGSIDVTHAGIIVLKQGKPYVIHSLSSDVSLIDGIQEQSLKEFLEQSAPGKIVITRACGTDGKSGAEIAMLAEKYLDRKIPFDHHGNFDDDNEFFCTELVWKILEKDLQIAALPTKPDERKDFFYSMAPMYDTCYFDVVINQYKK